MWTRPTGVALALLAAAVISASLMLAVSPRAHAVGATAAPVVNVRSYGARGNGKHNDTAAITRAMQAVASRQGTVLFPKGAYRVTSLTVPAHVTLRGAGMRKSWLHGRITASSYVHLTALKVGTRGHALHFVNGASHTTFTRVSFVGGGPMSGDGCVISFGAAASLASSPSPTARSAPTPYDGNSVSIADTAGAAPPTTIWSGRTATSSVRRAWTSSASSAPTACTRSPPAYYNINLDRLPLRALRLGGDQLRRRHDSRRLDDLRHHLSRAPAGTAPIPGTRASSSTAPWA